MPLLWFVYPLNGSGRRNPDAADRGQDSFLFFFFDVREMRPTSDNPQAALSFRSPDVNLRTAKALGLTVLPSVLAIADEVVE
jgi:hypothetical protein